MKVFREETWGERRGRLWTKEEIDKAISMRFIQHTDDEIAAALGRTKKSVEGKIGYWKKRR